MKDEYVDKWMDWWINKWNQIIVLIDDDVTEIQARPSLMIEDKFRVHVINTTVNWQLILF